MSAPQQTTADPQPLSSNVRSILSLALIPYLFGLWVLLSCPLGNEYMSGLHKRLGGLYQATMGETLGISVTGSPYFVHSGEPFSEDHLLELELTEGPGAGETIVFNNAFVHGSQAQQRVGTLATFMAVQASIGEDGIPAQFAKSLSAHAFHDSGAKRGVFRLRRHLFQPMDLGVGAATDPNAPSYFEKVYEADVWLDRDGQVQVLKRDSIEHVAPAVESQK
ncbi:hypothetical protein LOC68_05100 [Blastopirellula sp. JC732]|uniref:Uncharacterized protein n=1 Tax=Blastopirellula sediminis TaxID=2894196 RepID=A0A9X1SF04_9BACT|nr:hypothetical protein [Blastopirellula sediminis]MCC9609460.1 hypothetical protein [Blastopirellula sediminis]MCC9627763.1 hypothetical protein [Blastopirellula sediminis]